MKQENSKRCITVEWCCTKKQVCLSKRRADVELFIRSVVSFQTLNKNNLLPDERSNFYPTPLQQTNVYTTTYYPTPLGKFDYQPNSSPSPCRTYNNSNNS